MTKIGIITILKINNYGAELQAYALQKKLRDLGYEAEIIDYLFYKHAAHRPTRQSRSFVRLGIVKRIKEKLYPYIEKAEILFNYKTFLRRKAKFDGFHHQHTQMSPVYRSIEDLTQANHPYDVYITGSDQVWNPYSNTSLAPYFLHFAPDRKLKISYASSFGVSRLPVNVESIYRDYLNRFDFLSVREEAGTALIKKITGRQDVQTVLDPTFLLTADQWKSIAINSNIGKPFILLYELSPNPHIKKLAKHIKSCTSWEIVRVCKNVKKHDREKDIINICDAGPLELVGQFAKAEFVITNSFHGSAFAINFQKSFYTVISSSKINNARQENLLDLFHLKNRLMNENTPLPPETDFICDMERISNIMEECRKKSLDFLESAIKSKKYSNE
jgi:hypothetical protein